MEYRNQHTLSSQGIIWSGDRSKSANVFYVLRASIPLLRQGGSLVPSLTDQDILGQFYAYDPTFYGGVYISSKSNSSKTLSSTVFQFRNNAGDVAGGAPRFSLPIDTDGVGKTIEGYAFLDVAGCGGVSGDNTLVSTQSGICHVNFNGTDFANWTSFAAANPTYRMSPGAIPFIIADAAGNYSVDSIVLR